MISPHPSFVVVLSGFVLACAPRQVTPPADAPRDTTYRLALSDAGRLSLEASGVPLSRILADLRRQYSIEVRVPDFQDSEITDRFVALPLDSALRRLTRTPTAHVLGGDSELVIASDTGDKPDSRRTIRDATLPRKDTLAVIPLDPALDVKRAPDTLHRGSRPEGPSLKPPPRDTAQPLRAESKRRAPAAQDTSRYLWLALRLAQDGNLAVEGARVLDGGRIVSDVPVGPYYYVITLGARPIAIGSMPDPFEIRAYDPNIREPHRVARADTARFIATAPWQPLATARSEQIDIHVFRLPPDVELLPVTLQAATEVMRRSRPVGRLSPGVPRAPLDRVLPPSER